MMMKKTQQNQAEQQHWIDLGKSNKIHFLENARFSALEANTNERQFSDQITSIAGFFIALISGAFFLTNIDRSIKTILFIALIFFIETLMMGLSHIYSVKTLYESAVNAFEECDKIWSKIIRTKEEYDLLKDKSEKKQNEIKYKSSEIILTVQTLFLFIGLVIVTYAISKMFFTK